MLILCSCCGAGVRGRSPASRSSPRVRPEPPPTLISAGVWGSVRDAGRDGTFDSILFPTSLVVQNIPNTDVLDRAAFEFDLSLLPFVSTITSIELKVVLVSTTGGDTNYDACQYAGDGVVGFGDATAGSLLTVSTWSDNRQAGQDPEQTIALHGSPRIAQSVPSERAGEADGTGPAHASRAAPHHSV